MMWNKPWSMKEGFVIGAGLIVAGLLLQVSAGDLFWPIFSFPANAIILAVLVALLIVLYALRNKVYAIRFIKSYKMAVPTLVYAVALTIIMGLTKQSDIPSDPIGITHMLGFWPFVFIYFLMAMIVGLVAIENIVKLNWRKWPSIASHLGLFIVLVAGTLGSADMQRLKMYCETGKPEWRALDTNNNTHELDIAIQLDTFKIDEYPAKLMLVDNATSEAVMNGGKPLTLLLDNDFKGGKLGEWDIKVLQNLDYAAPKTMPDSTRTFVDWKMKGATSAAQVEATKGDKKVTGWVTCGNAFIPTEVLPLDDDYSLGMPPREPKRYASSVHIFTESQKNVKTTIEVNKPYTIDGWKIYQYSYNEQQGRWSDYSVFELVTDPWLPAVYVGIGLIFIGAVGMFITAQRRKETEASDSEASNEGKEEQA